MFELELSYPAVPIVTDAALRSRGILRDPIGRYRFAAYMPCDMPKTDKEALIRQLDAIPGPSLRPWGDAQADQGLGYIAVAQLDGRTVGCVNVSYLNYPTNDFVPFGLHSDFAHMDCERGLQRFARDVATYMVRHDPFTALNLAGQRFYRYNGFPSRLNINRAIVRSNAPSH